MTRRTARVSPESSEVRTASIACTLRRSKCNATNPDHAPAGRGSWARTGISTSMPALSLPVIAVSSGARIQSSSNTIGRVSRTYEPVAGSKQIRGDSERQSKAYVRSASGSPRNPISQVRAGASATVWEATRDAGIRCVCDPSSTLQWADLESAGTVGSTATGPSWSQGSSITWGRGAVARPGTPRGPIWCRFGLA
jgi:hypothetical protein